MHAFPLRLVLWITLSIALAQSIAGTHAHQLHAAKADVARTHAADPGVAAGQVPGGHDEDTASECHCPWCSPHLHVALAGLAPVHQRLTGGASLHGANPQTGPHLPAQRTHPPLRGPPAA